MRAWSRHPRLALIGAAALFSTGGAAIKGCGLSAWHVAGLRSLVAAVFLLSCVPVARRSLSVRSLPVAISFAATLTLFVAANKLTTAANAIFLQSTAPLYVLALAPLLLKEPVRKADLLFMAALALGLGLVLASADPLRITAPDPGRGNLLGLLAGALWGLTLLGLRAHGRGTAATGLGSVVLGNLLAAAVCLPLAGGLPALGGADALLLLYLGAVQIGLAYLLLTAGMTGVPAIEASLLLLVEPALAPIWAWAVHGEIPTALSVTGGAIILGATALRGLARHVGGAATR